jgi:hypothetical protein
MFSFDDPGISVRYFRADEPHATKGTEAYISPIPVSSMSAVAQSLDDKEEPKRAGLG